MRTARVPTWRVFVLALVIAASALVFCSKSSPAYPINDWSDANIYFSMGKGMADGQVIYRDLYDHKGPLIYALHALCALVSPLSFTGVFVLECLCAAAFLTIVYRLLELYGVRWLLWPAVTFIAVAVYSSYSFQQGDSAEELCLPLVMYAFYELIKQIKLDEPPSLWSVAVQGALFGCVFWTKFTLVGVYAAYALMLIISALRARDTRLALKYVGAFASGFAASTLPWIIYFGANGAIYDWLKVYLYDNLFLYSGGEGAGALERVKDILKSGYEWVSSNLLYTLPLALGIIWAAVARDADRREFAAIWLTSALAALGVFIGGKSYPYYGLALAFLCPLGLAYICARVERLFIARRNVPGDGARKGGAYGGSAKERLLRVSLCVLYAACAVISCYALSPNVEESFLLPRGETMQYKLAAYMERYDDPTLLNYGFMDAGFYTAAGITPRVKYFHQTNVPLQEMLDEQKRYIDEGVCDFVVTRGMQPASITERYDMVLSADSPGFWYEHVYLYKRKDLD